MVALSAEFYPELLAPGRIAFVAVNGLFDCVVLEGAAENEYRQRLHEGWRVVEVRPICRSLQPRIVHSLPELQAARVWSYSLVILEHATAKMPAPQVTDRWR